MMLTDSSRTIETQLNSTWNSFTGLISNWVLNWSTDLVRASMSLIISVHHWLRCSLHPTLLHNQPSEVAQTPKDCPLWSVLVRLDNHGHQFGTFHSLHGNRLQCRRCNWQFVEPLSQDNNIHTNSKQIYGVRPRCAQQSSSSLYPH